MRCAVLLLAAFGACAFARAGVVAEATSAVAGPVRVTCEQADAWQFELKPTERGGVSYVTVRARCATPARPPVFTLSFDYSGVGADHVWTPYDDNYMIYPSAWGGDRKYMSQIAHRSPLLTVFDDAGRNTLALSCSEAMRRLQYGVAVKESTCQLHCAFTFFTEFEPPRTEYEATVRIDGRRGFWADAVREASDWIGEVNRFVPCKVPEAAFDPLYSTWYAFWQDVHADVLEREMPLAHALGMRTAILDDGWQKAESVSFYSATGDWRPVASRFPDMKAHVDAVHKAGMKYMLWLSVPYVGDESAAWKRFQDKFLRVDGSKHPGAVGTLDPRFPEVRAYLTDTYVRAVRDWGFDGLKLDFIDCFRITGKDPAETDNYAGRDIRAVPEAVDVLMKGIVRALQEVRPDVLLEFRQQYMGPAIRQYGNMIRATDCPAHSDKIRKLIADLRLTSGTTAVHSDMLVWDPNETPERAARPILNSLFAVIQYSMVLAKLPPAHHDVIRHWLAFSQEHRTTLLKGAFRPYHPELLYPRVEAESDAEKIVALYSVASTVDVGAVAKPTYIINATAEPSVPVEAAKRVVAELYDVFGKKTGTQTLEAGLSALTVPVSGYARLR